MSSQGDNSRTGYTYTALREVRDASDYTRQLKEQRVYKSYNSSYTGNTETNNTWLKYGSGFHLTFLFGRLKCGSCTGNAFGGANAKVGGS